MCPALDAKNMIDLSKEIYKAREAPKTVTDQTDRKQMSFPDLVKNLVRGNFDIDALMREQRQVIY